MTRTRRIVALAALCVAPLARPDAPSLSLGEALDLAQRNSETPQIAQARMDRARAVRSQASALLFPEVVATGSVLRRAREVTREFGSETVVLQSLYPATGQVTLRTTLLDAKVIPLLRKANRDLEAGTLEAEETNRQFAYDVSTTFLGVLSAEQLAAAAKNRIAVAEQSLKHAQARHSAGLASRNDVTRAELEHATALQAAIDAEGAAEQLRLALGFLLNAPADRSLAAPPLVPPAAGKPEVMVERALAARSDLAARHKRAEAARFAAQEPMLRTLPYLELVGTLRGTNEAGLAANFYDWNVGLQLTWVLYDRGLRYPLADDLAAAATEAELAARQASRQVEREVRAALVDLDRARAGKDQAQVRARVAKQNAEEVAVRYQQGLANALEVADANASNFDAQAARVRADLASSLATLSLKRALGVGPLEAVP